MDTVSYKDRSVDIGSGEEALAGIVSVAAPSAPLIILAHGFGGDKDEKGLFSEAAERLWETGFSVLRFDFRTHVTHNGSARLIRLEDQVEDLKNVFRHIKTSHELRGHGPLGFIGFSLGAGIGLLARPKVKAFVLWSPAIYTDRDMVPRYQTPEVMHDFETSGYLLKGALKVSQEFINDLKTPLIPQALRSISAPTLLVHGRADQRIPWESTSRAGQGLRHTKLLFLPDADHSFRNTRQTRELLFEATLQWFKDKLAHRPRRVYEQGALDQGWKEMPRRRSRFNQRSSNA